MTEVLAYEVHAREVRPNDEYTPGVFVANVKSATKWTVLRDAEDKLIARVANDAMVSVNRVVKTQAEKDAELRAHTIDRLRAQLVDVLAVTPGQMLHEMADKQPTNPMDWSSGTSFLRKQAEYIVYSGINRTREVMISKFNYDEDDALLLGFAIRLLDEHRDDMKYWDPTSRSTNTLGNLIDDLEKWAPRNVRNSFTFNISMSTLEKALQAHRDLHGDSN